MNAFDENPIGICITNLFARETHGVILLLLAFKSRRINGFILSSRVNHLHSTSVYSVFMLLYNILIVVPIHMLHSFSKTTRYKR